MGGGHPQEPVSSFAARNQRALLVVCQSNDAMSHDPAPANPCGNLTDPRAVVQDPRMRVHGSAALRTALFVLVFAGFASGKPDSDEAAPKAKAAAEKRREPAPESKPKPPSAVEKPRPAP